MFLRVVRILLFPVSLIYGMIGLVRNILYDLGAFRSTSFPIPLISVGNLSVGGTGKTPHIEYLVRLLQHQNKVATLSRGYGRSTKGFRLASMESTAEEIGDEPRQFRQKFNSIQVAVDGNRVRGVGKLLTGKLAPEVILLDDAFQHRAVQPGKSILLTDYSRPYFTDYLLPTGTLREWRRGKRRADIIIVTKSPKEFASLERRAFRDKLSPRPYQKVYFTYLKYGLLIPLFDQIKTKELDIGHYLEREYSILLVTGIAQPQPLIDELEQQHVHFKHLSFPDHHRYTAGDVKKIQNLFDSFAGGNKLILTTEKDGMRLSKPGLNNQIEHLPIFYLPIEVAFHGKDGEGFNEQIVNYVGRNQIDRDLPQRTH